MGYFGPRCLFSARLKRTKQLAKGGIKVSAGAEVVGIKSKGGNEVLNAHIYLKTYAKKSAPIISTLKLRSDARSLPESSWMTNED